jgi:hypothetical protein
MINTSLGLIMFQIWEAGQGFLLRNGLQSKNYYTRFISQSVIALDRGELL